MELKINGRVKLIMDLQSWDSGFTKREFVITTNEQYPQDVKLECIKDKTNLLDGLAKVTKWKFHLILEETNTMGNIM